MASPQGSRSNDCSIRNRGSGRGKACSWCKRLEYGPEWLEVEAAIVPLGLFEDDAPPPEITHGICPDCAREMHALLDFS